MAQGFNSFLETISEGRDLEPETAREALTMIVEGKVSDEEVAAFLFGMRAKGETIQELTSFVQVMRQAAVPVEASAEGAVDLCGTGGDRSGTFNISTAAMFVVAGAGVPVLKHGNRGVSSKSGSADVLEALGAASDLEKENVEEVFRETKMAFMFAPNFHPAMKHVMKARKALKMRTFFNLLGPLLNPARVQRQVIGTFNREAARQMIQILGNLDTVRAYTLNAHDGMDEVSLSDNTEVYELQSKMSLGSVSFNPESLGYGKVKPETLKGGNAAANAEIITSVLNGTSTQAQRDIVTLNAAFGIHVSGKAGSLKESDHLAKESIDSGSAIKKLNRFAEATRDLKG